MDNAFGEPQTILLLGGGSEIGQAIVRRLATRSTRRVVLAARRPEALGDFAESLRAAGVEEVETIPFDARRPETHAAAIAGVVDGHGDLDLVICAFGVLGTQETYDADPAAAAEAVAINTGGAISSGVAVAGQLRRQGHGTLVVLSSVAGERVRKANYVYGATKAGLDAFAQGLSDALDGSGARVLIVRPGFVRSKMTAGLDAAPFSTTPDKVAEAVAAALRRKRRIVWVPAILRPVFAVFRHLPTPIWRRLPIN